MKSSTSEDFKNFARVSKSLQKFIVKHVVINKIILSASAELTVIELVTDRICHQKAENTFGEGRETNISDYSEFIVQKFKAV